MAVPVLVKDGKPCSGSDSEGQDGQVLIVTQLTKHGNHHSNIVELRKLK